MRILLIFVCLGFLGCSKSPVLSPIQDAGCAIESAISGAASGAVASALQCAHPDIMAQQLQAAFGNANLCATPLPASGVSGVGLMATSWKTIGDIPASALKPGMRPQAVHSMGIVGNIACPLAINAAVGFMSNSVPAAWGCSGPNATMSGLVTALTAACEMAVPL